MTEAEFREKLEKATRELLADFQKVQGLRSDVRQGIDYRLRDLHSACQHLKAT